MNDQEKLHKNSLNHIFKGRSCPRNNHFFSDHGQIFLRRFGVILLLSQSMLACIEEPPLPNRDSESELDQALLVADHNFGDTAVSDGVNDGGINGDLDVIIMDQGVVDMSEASDRGFDSDMSSNDVLDMNAMLEDWPALDLNPPPITQEVCDGVDNDFDSVVDEGLSNPCGGCAPFDEESGCSSWRVNLVQTQSVDEQAQVRVGSLNPQRLIALSAAVMKYERFDLEGASCVRYGAPQSWEAAWSMGNARLNTDALNLSFVPSSADPGRYRAIGVDESPFAIHEPQDQLVFSWDGILDSGRFDTPVPTILGDEFNMTSPALVRLAEQNELERFIDQVTQAEPDVDATPLALRWVPEPIRQNAGPNLSFYIGGSQLLYRRGAVQGIRHYQLNALLFDDGRLDLMLPQELQVPNSSVWVYLQRSQQEQSVMGSNPVIANIGHRYEARRSGGNGQNADLANIEIVSPNPMESEPELGREGLNIAWRFIDPTKINEAMAVSLILYDTAWSENLTCVLDNPSQTSLLIPEEFLEFWPQGSQSVRQITLSSQQKSLDLTYPDRGTWRLSESLILRLSDL